MKCQIKDKIQEQNQVRTLKYAFLNDGKVAASESKLFHDIASRSLTKISQHALCG